MKKQPSKVTTLTVASVAKPEPVAVRFPLLLKAIGAGDVIALFPLFKGWEKEWLRELLLELEEASELSDEQFRQAIFKPEVFFSDRASKAIQAAHFDTFVTLSEVASVALYYLGAQA